MGAPSFAVFAKGGIRDHPEGRATRRTSTYDVGAPSFAVVAKGGIRDQPEGGPPATPFWLWETLDSSRDMGVGDPPEDRPPKKIDP